MKPRRVAPVFLPGIVTSRRLLDPPAREPETLESWTAHAGGALEAAAGAQIGLYGGSIAALPEEMCESVLAFVRERAPGSKIRVVLEPDQLDEALLPRLVRAEVSTVEIDAGSFDGDALAACGFSFDATEAAQALARASEASIDAGLILRPGMPGATAGEALRSAKRAVELGPSFVRIYPVLVLAGTLLEEAFASRRYRPLGLDEAVDSLGELLRLFAEAKIPVSRVGLQPAVDLPDGGRVVAGPWHPALRDLAEAPIWLERASRLIAANFRFQKEATLIVHPRDESRLRGPAGDTLKRLRAKYRFEKLVVRPDPEAERDSLVLEIHDPAANALRAIAG